jgi:hypothetical protein
MSTGKDRLRDLQAGERRRRAAIALALSLPWLLLIGAAIGWSREDAAWRMAASIALLIATVIAGAWAWRRASAVDAVWLSRQMDAQRPDLEDSSDLLFKSPAALPALAGLQQARLQQRLRLTPLPDLRTRWPWRAVLASALLAAACAAIVLSWNALAPGARLGPAAARNQAYSAQQTRIVRQALEISPPAYTGLATRRQGELAAKVPAGSRLRWTLQFAPQPAAAQLIFHDGSRLALQRQGPEWTGSRIVDKPTFYRLRLQASLPLPAIKPQRIDIIADQAPLIRVSEPDRTLTVLGSQRAQWPLAFEASDDYGLGAAQLRITHAQGTGENISVTARTIALPGQGTARRRSYQYRLDLAALGFVVGDDLVVRLSISDNRAPSAQTTHSASFILRWPVKPAAQATGVEGLLTRSLPAYFRSERQIIIDSEALLAQRGKLDAEHYLKRSDEIAVDQRILRMRYGQFLGQETAEAPKSPASTAGADQSDTSAASASAAGDRSGADSVIATFGDVHDKPEAATMLDPETRALLKSALDEMWQAELNLHLGKVNAALPSENRALRFIKQVQQATRIYLARVGVELPPIDESRRLSGDRKGLQSQRDALIAARIEASPALALWQALENGRARAAGAELDGFERWLRERESTLPGALDLFAALDAVRAEPDCAACALRLRNRLWPLLPAQAPVVDGRRAPDASGRAYLDALKGEGGS